MLTLNTILKELKNVPVDRLEELHVFINSLKSNTNRKKSDSSRKKILSFGESFSDMSLKDYNSFKEETRKTRTDLFSRDIIL